MTKLLHDVCILPTGKIRMEHDAHQTGPEDWVYQRRPEGKGNISREFGPELQLRRHGTRTDRLTSKNRQHRERFRLANLAWHEADESRRQAYRYRARNLPLTGYNLWMREWTYTPTAPKRHAGSIGAILGISILERMTLCL